MKLSPSETIAVVGDPGLATAAGAPVNPTATIAAKTAAFVLAIEFPSLGPAPAAGCGDR
jgi:hypothetical protein